MLTISIQRPELELITYHARYTKSPWTYSRLFCPWTITFSLKIRRNLSSVLRCNRGLRVEQTVRMASSKNGVFCAISWLCNAFGKAMNGKYRCRRLKRDSSSSASCNPMTVFSRSKVPSMSRFEGDPRRGTGSRSVKFLSANWSWKMRWCFSWTLFRSSFWTGMDWKSWDTMSSFEICSVRALARPLDCLGLLRKINKMC